ncbi:hypothetical protein SmJEL517_g02817 [Synchytrium microbalum]|uniref:Ribosomal RNA-processing protein 41 n=1 Tax=Synchytrium microbalum TaxID=1806994 RepID=A0A507CAM0_9FUNG|nr:uncharacterized protein SmJEL517_g02817 [Synchytrium microbalum]TPX34565.1 hypothetical protein SmJEL517_g02817 [Synchytrium microbalum]
MGSRRQEIVSPEGLRTDGRRPTELRRISCRMGVFSTADGSAYLQHGNTKLIAAVYGPREPSQHQRGEVMYDRAFITVKYNVASFSLGERRKASRLDRRNQEVANIIKKTFETVIETTKYKGAEIAIYIQLLQVDGGSLHAAINAATLAILDAGIEMSEYVCACSAGWANDAAILDLNYIEESADVPTVTVAVLPKSGKVISLGMETRLHLDVFESVVNRAKDGCHHVHKLLDAEVRERTQELLLSMS